MTSIACLSGSISFCVCPSSQIRHSWSESGARPCSSSRNFNPGNGTIRASRPDSTLKAEATQQSAAGKSERQVRQESTAGPSVQSHLDLLERFTSEASANKGGRTIAEQLESQADFEKAEEMTVPLAQNANLDMAPLTIHQKRNIRRQKYLDEVAKRNDAPFFTIVALTVILPPSVILAVAVATGYVQLFP